MDAVIYDMEFVVVVSFLDLIDKVIELCERLGPMGTGGLLVRTGMVMVNASL